MRLHEEYIRRHQLEIPIIRYDSRSNVFLKTKNNPCRWGILSIIWRPQSGKPGFYEFVRIEPIHNGIGAFRATDKEVCVYWDEYDAEVERIVSQCRNDGFYAIPSRERGLMAWEMFLFMFDGWLADRMDRRFYQYVEQSTVASLDINTRAAALRNASRMLSDYPGADRVLDLLNYQIMPMVNGHSQWLEDLVNA